MSLVDYKLSSKVRGQLLKKQLGIKCQKCKIFLVSVFFSHYFMERSKVLQGGKEKQRQQF